MRFLVRPLIAGVLALSAAAPAFADPPGRGGYGYDRGYDRRDDRRDWRDDRRDDRRDWRDDRRDDRRDWRRDARHEPRWRRGDRFDRNRTRYVVVNDYHRYHAPPPRRGEYYARTDTGELLLIAAATGLVLWALTD